MPRISRSFIKSSFFHVMVQGIDRSYIFENSEDIKYYIKIMYKLSKEQNVKIKVYCIMNNHAHILIETKGTLELSKYMQRLNTIYGIYYNKKYERVGYVFRNRFKSESICNEEHLYNCMKYIYNNPVKAGICERAKDYPYSNYNKESELKGKREYVFLDVDEDKDKIIKDFLKEFFLKNNTNITILKEDIFKLRELIIILKDKYRVSLRKISGMLGINREKVRNIYKG